MKIKKMWLFSYVFWSGISKKGNPKFQVSDFADFSLGLHGISTSLKQCMYNYGLSSCVNSKSDWEWYLGLKLLAYNTCYWLMLHFFYVFKVFKSKKTWLFYVFPCFTCTFSRTMVQATRHGHNATWPQNHKATQPHGTRPRPKPIRRWA